MATLDVLSSPSGTIRPNRRRNTNSSSISEDDISALRSAEIDIDGRSSSSQNRESDRSALPSISVNSSESSSKPQISAQSTSASGKGRGVSMASLKSILGVPATPTTPASSSSSTSQSGPTSLTNMPNSSASSSNDSLAPPSRPFTNSNGAGLLGVPPSTSARTAPPGIGGASGASLSSRTSNNNGEDGRALLTSEIAPKRKKVVLEPGCSALDWARTKQGILTKRMQSGPQNMAMKRITKEELKKHNTREDAWSAFQGKVYDISPYLKFHPGGVQELMRVAGRDGTRMFMLTHSWVNIDAMIDVCCVGVLVSDS